ncbi:MAG TPA: 6-carboxytetrahydropterin synthase [Nitrospiraceae bacterium]|jgi:6-pyruvoyltetrahydropterin/6-carboxytetrahydropterin synthase|nr:6-carboxytetrahydropterin synthase [Nitrospiraceae bacterium]
MAQASVTRRYRFCAAHRLHTDHLSQEENLAAFGKCNNPNGHGHNYVVLVTVKSTVPTTTGGGVDLDRLDRAVADKVVTRFDHHDLNQDPEFADCTTTGENLVLLIWDLLVKCLPAGQLEKVGLIETRDNYFEYAGSMSQAPVVREGRHG